MSKKKIKEDENIFEKLEIQNKALQKIIRKLKPEKEDLDSKNKNNNS